jgi:hypothetical protein
MPLVDPWRQTNQRAEDGGEMALARKAQLKAHLRDPPPGIGQELTTCGGVQRDVAVRGGDRVAAGAHPGALDFIVVPLVCAFFIGLANAL